MKCSMFFPVAFLKFARAVVQSKAFILCQRSPSRSSTNERTLPPAGRRFLLNLSGIGHARAPQCVRDVRPHRAVKGASAVTQQNGAPAMKPCRHVRRSIRHPPGSEVKNRQREACCRRLSPGASTSVPERRVTPATVRLPSCPQRIEGRDSYREPQASRFKQEAAGRINAALAAQISPSPASVQDAT